MERLKLETSPLEVLEVELPDGGKLVLKLKDPDVNESDKMERDILALNLKLSKKDEEGNSTPDITNTKYSVGILKTICEEFDMQVIGSLKVTHLIQIAESVIGIQKKVIDRKKKEKSSAASKNSKSAVTV